MARDGFDRGCSLAGGIALSGKTQRWILDISCKQCSLDRLGLALILLQVCLSLLNFRGAQKNDPAEAGMT